MNLSELKSIWEKEKEAFKQKEIGGLQDFVKEVLSCPDVFALKRGLESTKLNNRNYEFTIETFKNNRRADFVLYISNEIIIPVEVEKHENIEQGEWQIFQYQRDWDKKYGILTDGNEWRFYRSSQYRKFTLNEILSYESPFLNFWKQYIQSDTYYVELLTPSGQQYLFKQKLNLNVIKNRELFFVDTTNIIRNFKNKMANLGIWDTDESGKIIADKTAVETSYSYLIQFILYKVLVDNGFTNFKYNYEKLFRIITKAIKDNDFYSIIVNEIKSISEYISQNIYSPFHDEQQNIHYIFQDKLKSDLNIDDIAPWLDILLYVDKYDFSNIKNEIFGFIYENYLKDLYQEKKGQYFTDPAIVNFMLEEIGYNSEQIKAKASNNELSIIDPSCGAGTFLHSCVDRLIQTFDNGTKQKAELISNLIRDNIFGLDIEEFPLYLAEMNILMRLLPLIINDNYNNPMYTKLKLFKTNDSITEFLEIEIDAKVELNGSLFHYLDFTALNYVSFMRDETEIKRMIESLLTRTEERTRFDFVIGNPPYISYNEVNKLNVPFTKLIKDKLDQSITMSNVYGVNLNSVPNIKKPYSPKPNLYAFFIALGLALLKENGKLCYIIPQTVLNASDLDVIRYHLSKYATIESIVIFSSKLFTGRGLKQKKSIPTSSLIITLRRKLPSVNNSVKVISYYPFKTNNNFSDFEELLQYGKKEVKEIKQTELLENLNNWNYLSKDNQAIIFLKLYSENSKSIENYRIKDLDSYDEMTLDGGLKLEDSKISSHKTDSSYKVYNYKFDNTDNYCVKNKFLYYSKNDTIKYIPGGQKFKAYRNKYKIIWPTRFNFKFRFADIEDLILNGNQSLLISSNNRAEILFLFALLNSKTNIEIIKIQCEIPNEAKFLFPIRKFKNTIRIPLINTDDKVKIKKEIIAMVEKFLKFETYQLQHFINFTTLQQKFGNVSISSRELVLTTLEGDRVTQKIHSHFELVNQIIVNKFNGNIIPDPNNEISLNDLKYLEVIDFEERSKVKNYIDNLVFALYFNVEISKLGYSEADNINAVCNRIRKEKSLF